MSQLDWLLPPDGCYFIGDAAHVNVQMRKDIRSHVEEIKQVYHDEYEKEDLSR